MGDLKCSSKDQVCAMSTVHSVHSRCFYTAARYCAGAYTFLELLCWNSVFLQEWNLYWSSLQVPPNYLFPIRESLITQQPRPLRQSRPPWQTKPPGPIDLFDWNLSSFQVRLQEWLSWQVRWEQLRSGEKLSKRIIYIFFLSGCLNRYKKIMVPAPIAT